MKENIHILTLQETEELCRLYMECQLSVLEEKELQYILSELPYSSPVIDEARESMIAEGLLTTIKPANKKPKFRSFIKISSIAASLTILFVLSVFMINQTISENGGLSSNDSPDEYVVAYAGGKRLARDEAEKAVEESMKKAEALMAMADSRQKEEEMKQESLIRSFSYKN